MPYKQYAKFEKVFYLYGSTVKLITGVRPDEWHPLAEEIWSWANGKVEELVTVCMEGFLDPPPVVETPRQESPNGQVMYKGNGLKQKHITVKTVSQVKSGTRKNGGRWTLSLVRDMDNIEYKTFAGSRYEPGSIHMIAYKEVQNGQYINREIEDSKEREPGEDDE
jgi:hypothetical protein